MADRKGRAARRGKGSGQTSRANRVWKDETNPTRDAAEGDENGGDQPLSSGSPDRPDPSVPATRRAQAGRPDQGGKWQTGAGSAGATESDGRMTEHEGRSDQAGLKK